MGQRLTSQLGFRRRRLRRLRMEPLEHRRLLAADGFQFSLEALDANGQASTEFAVGELVTLELNFSAPDQESVNFESGLILLDDGSGFSRNIGNSFRPFDPMALEQLDMVARVVSRPENGTAIFLEKDASAFEPIIVQGYFDRPGTSEMRAVMATAGRQQFESHLTAEITRTDIRPESVADSFSIQENTVLTSEVSVLDNDQSSTGADLQSYLLAAPTDGSVTLRSDGTFDYTPHPYFVGQDTFTYAAIEDGILGQPATVTIDVTADLEIEDVLSFQFVATDLDGTPTEQVVAGEPFLVDLVVDSEYPNIERIDVLKMRFEGLRIDGQVTSINPLVIDYGERFAEGVTGSITASWTINAGQQGNELGFLAGARYVIGNVETVTPQITINSLTVMADGQVVTIPADRVRVEPFTIEATNGLSAQRDSYIITDTPENILLPVLTNDRGQDITITDVSVENGNARITDDGTAIEYQPPGTYPPIADLLEYTITDANGSSRSTAVTITLDPDPILGGNFLKGPNEDNLTVAADAKLTEQRIDVLANDPNSQKLRLVGVQTVSGKGNVRISDDELAIIYTPAADSEGTETFQYTVANGVYFLGAAALNVTIEAMPADMNGDGEISPIDPLMLVNYLNNPLGQGEGEDSASTQRFDVNGDRAVTPMDVLLLVNYLNSEQSTPPIQSPGAPYVHDYVLAFWANDLDRRNRLRR